MTSGNNDNDGTDVQLVVNAGDGGAQLGAGQVSSLPARGQVSLHLRVRRRLDIV